MNPPPFDIDRALNHLRQTDDKMAELMETAGAFGLRIRPGRTVFEVLLRSIVYQQLSDRAAGTIYDRVTRLLGDGHAPEPGRVLLAPTDDLRAAGMSHAKIRAARDLAERVLGGLLPDASDLQTMPDDEIIDRLTTVRGIGPWTVQMLLIFHLGRPDVLPLTDLGVRKGYMYVYKTDALPTPAQLAERGERWRPFRSVASWYLWRAVDLETGVLPPSI